MTITNQDIKDQQIIVAGTKVAFVEAQIVAQSAQSAMTSAAGELQRLQAQQQLDALQSKV